MEELQFSYNSVDYVVKVWKDDHTLYVRTFCNDKPVNPFTYQVSFGEDYKYFEQQGMPGKELLIEQATSDVHEGRIYGKKL